MRVTPLNLASRPVRNERLPALLFLLAAFALLLVTVQHAVIVYRLRPGGSRALHAEVAKLREESRTLTTEGSQLRGVAVNPKAESEWTALKDLVDRRTFWWSRLFQLMEQTMPREVRIVSISPKIKGRERHIEMTVRVQDVEDGFRFVQTLEGRPEFAEVKVPSYDQGRDSEVEFNLTMRYLAADPKPVASPAPAADTSARLAQSEGAR